MSNWDLERDEEIDIAEIIKKLKYILVKLTAKDFVIILIILMMFLMYILLTNDIAACNAYYQDLLKNSTQLTTSLW